jgi:arylsulfatase A-like enzyme
MASSRKQPIQSYPFIQVGQTRFDTNPAVMHKNQASLPDHKPAYMKTPLSRWPQYRIGTLIKEGMTAAIASHSYEMPSAPPGDLKAKAVMHSQKRLWFISIIGLALIGAIASALLATTAMAAGQKLNFLFIVVDDLRDTLGCYGNAAVKTPNMDLLAMRGVRFDRAYAQYPVCNASRTSFMTGLRCEQTGVTDNNTFFRSKLPHIVTMPQLLRQRGWKAFSYGKIFHVAEVHGQFRDDLMDIGKSWDEAQMFHATPAGKVIHARNLTGGKLSWCRWGAASGTDDDQPDGQTALHAIAAIERQSAAGQAWFVGAGFHRPHDPFISPEKYFDLYPAGSLRLYHDPVDMTPTLPLALPAGRFREAFNAFTNQKREEFQRAYYAAVSFTDAQVGRLMKTLDRLKLWESTVVILAGDNGYHHNERGWWNKNTLFERSCRVPLIVCAPDAKAGQACHSLVELVDLYPTVIDYCGLLAPHELAGRSLRPLLIDPKAAGKSAAFTLIVRDRGRYGQSVRTERWRYTRWSDGTNELYDEHNDTQETQDLSANPRYDDEIVELAKLLEQVGDFPLVAPKSSQ